MECSTDRTVISYRGLCAAFFSHTLSLFLLFSPGHITYVGFFFHMDSEPVKDMTGDRKNRAGCCGAWKT